MDAMGMSHHAVQLVARDFRAIPDRSRDELRHGRLSEEGGAAASVIEPAVHGDEASPEVRIRGRKGRSAEDVVPAESDEQRLAEDIWIARPALRGFQGWGAA